MQQVDQSIEQLKCGRPTKDLAIIGENHNESLMTSIIMRVHDTRAQIEIRKRHERSGHHDNDNYNHNLALFEKIIRKVRVDSASEQFSLYKNYSGEQLDYLKNVVGNKLKECHEIVMQKLSALHNDNNNTVTDSNAATTSVQHSADSTTMTSKAIASRERLVCQMFLLDALEECVPSFPLDRSKSMDNFEEHQCSMLMVFINSEMPNTQ